MQIFIDNVPVEAQTGESLLTIVRRLGLDTVDLRQRPLAADLGGEVFTLNYVPCREQDKLPAAVGYRERRGIRRSKGRISLIRYGENRGQRVYERTLLFVFLLAVRELFPEAHVRVNYAIGAGLYITLAKETPLVRAEVDALRRKCREMTRCGCSTTGSSPSSTSIATRTTWTTSTARCAPPQATPAS